MLLRLLFLLLVFTLPAAAFAQNAPVTSCGEKQLMDDFFAHHPKEKKANDNIEKLLAEQNRKINAGQVKAMKVNGVATLPVVVHIIHNNGGENISDAQVFAGIQHLNEAFANTGYYDPSDGVNTQIQFCMAQRDPANNPTNGITRNVSPYTVMGGSNYYADDQQVKNIIRWNPDCYINIWLVQSIPGSVVGYAYLPSAHGTAVDGIIEEAAYFGSSYANDVVIIHETGHYLGLYHTFEGACTNNDCTSDGDKVCDTPPDQSTAGISCTSSANSCTTDALSGFATDQNDLTQDYMDYGNFNCMKVFTQGQADRMNFFLQNVRQSLLACRSCMAPCPAPVTASFTSPGATFVAGTPYTFTNTSVNAATYEWYVNGVLQSTATNLLYTFTGTGSFTIKLVAKTGNVLCDDATSSDTIKIVCGVTAGFTKSAAVAACGTNISFTNTSSGADGYQWFVNNVVQSAGTNFIYTSSAAGKYIIKLVAKNTAANCSQEFIDTVEYTCAVTAGFTPLSNTVILNTPVTFTSTATGATTYQWFINGTAAGSSPVLNYTFTAIGTYSIQLLAGNGTCTAVKFGVVYVTDKCGNAEYLFQKSYASGAAFNAVAVAPTTDGGCAMAENFAVPGSNNSVAAILRTDAGGNVQWVNSYGDNLNNSYFSKIKATQDGGFIAIGGSSNGPSNNTNIFIVKTSATGTLIWSKLVTAPYSGGTDIIQAADGSYYFSGYAQSVNSVNYGIDALVGSLDISGNILWLKTYDSRSDETANSLAEDNKQLIVCGNKSGQSTAGFLLSLIKIDGSVTWAKTYQSSSENFKTIAVTKNGYYVDVLKTAGQGGLYTDHVYFTTDYTGKPIYTRYIQPFGAAKGAGFSASFMKSDGNIISLTSGEFGGTYYDFLLQEVNPASGIAWTKKYNVPGTWMGSLSASADNGILMAGMAIIASSANPLQTALIKTDTAGKGGTCPSVDANIQLLNAQYNTTLADFTSNYLLAEALPVNLLNRIDVITQTNCQYIKCDSIATPVDTCLLCNTIKLFGQDTVCNLTGTIIFKAVKNPLCPLPVQWGVDTAFAKIISSTDTTILLQFIKAGNTVLHAQFATLCIAVKDSLAVNITPSPTTIDLGPDIELCSFSTLQLNAGKGFKSYLWGNGTVDSVLTAYTPGQYFVQATDYCGNIYRDTINITQAPTVVFDLGADRKKCNGDSLTISAPGNFSKYTWSPNYNISNTNSSTITVWPTADTTYTVVAEITKGCTVLDSIRISVNKSKIINIGNDTSLCQGSTKLFKAPAGFTKYVWQDGSGNPSFTAAVAGTYFVQVTDSNGCISKDTALIKQVYALPIISLGNDTDLCSGKTYIFNAGTGYASYLWQDGSLNNLFVANAAGVYWVQVTDNNNCKGGDTAVIQNLKPSPQNFLDATAEFCRGKSVELTALGQWNSYLWSSADTTATVTVTTGGDYWLQVSNAAGCSARDTIKVVQKDCVNGIWFPTAFSPNNDGKNDLYKPVVHGQMLSIHFTIYNRYGIKVFETTNPNNAWDGMYKGKPLDAAAFVWHCTYQFAGTLPTTVSGSVVLVR